MEKILIDLGSSTVKVYKQKDNRLHPLLIRSISFKDGFTEDSGISQSSKKELLELLFEIKNKHKGCKIKIYATALHRKLPPQARRQFIDEIFENTGIYLNIISQDLENFYLESALVGKCTLDCPLLLLNIGGGSTELVVMYGREAIERYNLDLGVGTVLSKFVGINDQFSKIKIDEIKLFVKKALPNLKNKVETAFYNGGELTYMKIAGYNISQNDIFKDEDHPQKIDIDNFSKRNSEIFSKVSLKELEELMPQNPKWMHGARACSAIAEAVFEKYKIKTIIPSDSNLVHGVVRQEFSISS
ncbi:hypothetical protein L6255_00260 [Candidatus Parcubacteria bacterium]|nr:hypothetical protein [Patescibacteria group bacterium]MCG2688873.1 hypothetical protein [Candidatus Parcubacteria bacterium]